MFTRNRKEPSNNLCEVEQHSWVNTWPTNYATKMDDSSFLFGLRYRFNLMVPPNYVCQLDSKNLNEMNETECFQHVESCASCGGIFFHIRHENVNTALHYIFKKKGIFSTLNPKDLPLPDKNKGGPDFILASNGKMFCGDVSITKNSTTQTYKRKLDTYKEFEQETGFTTFPFIMSTQGKFHHKTMDLLKQIERENHCTDLCYNVVNDIQCVLVKALFCSYSILKARGHCLVSSKGGHGEAGHGESLHLFSVVSSSQKTGIVSSAVSVLQNGRGQQSQNGFGDRASAC